MDGFVHALASRRQDLHQLIVDTIAGAVTARRAVLAVGDHAGERLTVTATRGGPAAPATGSVIAPGAGITGRTFATRRPHLVSDAAAEPGEPWFPSRGGSCISVPLVARGSALGAITLADRAGGQPFDGADLAAVQGLAATAALALAYERVEKVKNRLEQVVAVDPLTGLLNRGGLDARLGEELDRARRHREPVALIAIDVDRFKSLNDALGHPAGDAVLKGLAAIFDGSVRAGDLCARFGGDEFAIVMPRTAAAGACQSADRIRRRVQDYWPDSVSPRPAGPPRHRQLRGGGVGGRHHAGLARRTGRPGALRGQGQRAEPGPARRRGPDLRPLRRCEGRGSRTARIRSGTEL